MFNFRGFIKAGLLDAVGKMPDYWIILNAGGWCKDGILLEEDLVEIQAKINAQHSEVNPEPVEE
jgi:hypothetical protein